jgi:hypothetical protein
MPGLVSLLRPLGRTSGSHLNVSALLVLHWIGFEIVLCRYNVSNPGNAVKV